ncbi:MAG: F0F1 ATP synthase subunit delta [Candidatus Saccharibacteria bacterium]
MKASISSIASIISSKTIGGNPPKNLSKDIAAYLLDEGRTGELSSLLRTVQEDWAQQGIVEATVSSAFSVNESVKQDIKAEIKKIYPNAKNINLIMEHDPSLVGGIKISTANDQMDISILSKLSKFKQLTLAS